MSTFSSSPRVAMLEFCEWRLWRALWALRFGRSPESGLSRLRLRLESEDGGVCLGDSVDDCDGRWFCVVGLLKRLNWRGLLLMIGCWMV